MNERAAANENVIFAATVRGLLGETCCVTVITSCARAAGARQPAHT